MKTNTQADRNRKRKATLFAKSEEKRKALYAQWAEGIQQSLALPPRDPDDFPEDPFYVFEILKRVSAAIERQDIEKAKYLLGTCSKILKTCKTGKEITDLDQRRIRRWHDIFEFHKHHLLLDNYAEFYYLLDLFSYRSLEKGKTEVFKVGGQPKDFKPSPY